MESHDPSSAQIVKIHPAAVIVIVIVVCIGFAGLFGYGYIQHRQSLDFINAQAQENAEQPAIVNIAIPKPMKQTYDLSLPGDAKAMQETALYARVNGYLKSWTHDIDSKVQEGEVLAVIAAPDLDAQVDQAKAAVDQANANLNKAQKDQELAQATYQRYQGLAPSGNVTQQQLDEKQSAASEADAAYVAAEAQVKSAKANVE